MQPTEVLTIILNASMVGFGSALGSYFANNHLLKKLQEIKKRGK